MILMTENFKLRKTKGNHRKQPKNFQMNSIISLQEHSKIKQFHKKYNFTKDPVKQRIYLVYATRESKIKNSQSSKIITETKIDFEFFMDLHFGTYKKVKLNSIEFFRFNFRQKLNNFKRINNLDLYKKICLTQFISNNYY